MIKNDVNHSNITPNQAQHLKQGVEVPGPIPDPIHRSWERCVQLGLSVDYKPELDLATNVVLNELREKNAHLIHQSQVEMENLYAHIAGTQSMVILSDANGTILSAMGDPEFMSKAERVALQPGVSWKEEITGTNAIGTALVEKSPVFVMGAQHYFESNAFLNCSAAPIQDPLGNTIGVLDLSGDHRQPYEHTMSLVRMSAQMIENKLFNTQFLHDIIIRFHTRPEFIGTLWEGIVVFSNEGKLLAASKSALFQLGLDSKQYLGSSFESIFGIAMPRFLDRAKAQQSLNFITLNTPNGLRLFTKIDRLNKHMVQASQLVKPDLAETKSQLTGSVSPLERLDTGDEAMHATIEKAKLVAHHDVAILIEGETGSGKEMLAKAIHQSGARKNGAFVAINCAAIPEGLIESELFGHEEGAFTGARRRGAIGRVQQAQGGTLFLDEIGEMPLNLQARLLRVIQEREIAPLGSNKTIQVDISIISATNNRLKDLVARGQFREDLYYRLNGIRLTLPPLRQRSDLVTLIHTILAENFGLAHVKISQPVLELMQRHPWQGNVRQLYNVLKAATIFMQDNTLELAHLPEDFVDEMHSIRPQATQLPERLTSDMASSQKALIQQALTHYKGNMTAAALHLGISRATVYRKAKKLGLVYKS